MASFSKWPWGAGLPGESRRASGPYPVRLVLHYGRSASAAEFVRVPALEVPLSYRDATKGVRMLLDRGLPAEAWLLGCQDPRIEQSLLLECELRLGIPPSGWFAPF